MQYKCAPRSDSFISDIMVDYPAETKDHVLQLRIDKVSEVTGTLTTTGSLIGLGADYLPQ